MQVFGRPATPQQQQVKQEMPGQLANAEPYTRQAAANLIGRLRKNPGRIEEMGQLKSMVFDDSRKSELITLLCQHNGSLAATSATLVLTEERGESETNSRRALRLTRKQMLDTYGDDAQAVMKYKEDNGLTETDVNCPNMVWYLQMSKEDEQQVWKSNSVLLKTQTFLDR